MHVWEGFSGERLMVRELLMALATHCFAVEAYKYMLTTGGG